MNTNQKIVSQQEWTDKRVALLKKEKEFIREQDKMSQQVRALPWEKVNKNYQFHGQNGPLGLSDLFTSKSQLIIYHFMFAADWEEGCKSCSIITDSLNACTPHLAARDVAMALVSRGPIEKLLAFRKRMHWDINWVSAIGTEFNQDYQACTDQVDKDGLFYYNYEQMSKYPQGEQPGLSVFAKDENGDIYHTYSSYARGLESFLGTYALLNIVPKGRDEDQLAWPMEWIRHKDKYDV